MCLIATHYTIHNAQQGLSMKMYNVVYGLRVKEQEDNEQFQVHGVRY